MSGGILSRDVNSKLSTELPTRVDKSDGEIRALKASFSEPVFLVLKVA